MSSEIINNNPFRENESSTDQPFILLLINKHEQYLNTLEEDKEKNKSSISSVLSDICNLYYMLGDYTNALVVMKKSLEIKKTVSKDYQLTSSRKQLANVFIKKGDFINAEFQYRTALKYEEGRLGKNDPFLIDKLLKYASILSRLNKYDLSREYVVRALQINMEAEEYGYESSGRYYACIAEGFLNNSDYLETYRCIDYARKCNSLDYIKEPGNICSAPLKLDRWDN